MGPDTFTMPDLPPDAVLITGPAGSGKTEAAIDAILDVRLFRPFSAVWVLLATGQQIHAFRERLLARSTDAVQFGVEFFDFETLYARILDLLGDPQRQVEDTSRYQILRHVTAGLQARGELELFGEIAQMPGFIGLLAGLIHELKQGLVQPDAFSQVADSFGAKDRDLARMYAGYQDFLRDQNLVDRHGAGWLAVEHLERGDRLPVPLDLLVVDGFDQFNCVHVRLLTALAGQVPQTVLTLTDVPGEPGRHFRRFEQTRDRLLHAAQGRDVWRVQAVDVARNPSPRAPVLDHLVRVLFQSQPDQVPGDESLRLIEAPDTGREVGAVLRRGKARLLAGASPESVVIIARDMARYGTALRETARAYGVPLVVREGMPLRENPVVALLLAVLDLAAHDFPRRDLLDALHSPYLNPPDLTPDQIAQLERISLERQVVRGADVWLDAIADSAAIRIDEDGEPREPLIDPDSAAELHAALAALFDRLTPPASGTAYDLVAWIEALVGPDPEAVRAEAAEGTAVTEGTAAAEVTAIEAHSDDESSLAVGEAHSRASHCAVIVCIRAGSDAAFVVRDVAAMRKFQGVLAGIRAAHDLLAGRGDLSVLWWDEFRGELQLAVDRAAVMPSGGLSRLGRVLATDVLEARGLPHDDVFILGLSEGEFPAQEPEGALYQEGERLALERAGIDMLTAVERADDMSLFYQAVGLARRSLTLSRYTVDGRGDDCPPSPYWRAVLDAVRVPDDQRLRLSAGSAPVLDDAATLSEAAVAVAAIFSGEHTMSGAVLNAYNALLDHAVWGDRWRAVLRGRAVESAREEEPHASGRFGGVLDAPDLIEQAAARLDSRRVWSASQFNEYGACPFRFFARRLLRLEELDEPEEGLDRQQLGSLNHAILEHVYRRLGDEGVSITPDNLDHALAVLDDEAGRFLADAPRAYGFRPSAVWAHEQAELLRRLRWLVERDFSDDSHVPGDGEPRHAFWQEAVFGLGDQPPLVIDGPAGALRVRGKIDRMDRAGDRVIVIDYKTGSAPHPVRDLVAGRDFQMMIYLLAALDLLRDSGLEVAGGLFWHIRNRKTSGAVDVSDSALAEAYERLHANVIAARGGNFPVAPNQGRCVPYCEYGALCRFTRTAGLDSLE